MSKHTFDKYKYILFIGTLVLVSILGFILYKLSFTSIFIALLCCYIFILSRLTNRSSKTISFIRASMLTGLIFWFLSFITIEALIIAGGKPMEAPDTGYMLILGAGLKGERPSISLTERLEKASEFLIQNPQVKVIVSGGQGTGESISEAEAIARYLMGHGIAAARIIKEDQATSTYENIAFSKAILNNRSDYENKPVIVVTSSYHIFRARLLAQKAGLSMVSIPAKTPFFLYVKYIIREYFAVVHAFIFEGKQQWMHNLAKM